MIRPLTAMVVLAGLLVAACGSDGPEERVRAAIGDYVAAVNAGESLSNCTEPFYTAVAADHPELRPFRYEVDAIEMDAGDYRVGETGTVEITPDREGDVAVVRGRAYLGDRAVAELAGSSFADTGWLWFLEEDGRWLAFECS